MTPQPRTTGPRAHPERHLPGASVVLAVVLAGAAFLPVPAFAGDLTIRLCGMENRNGNLLIAVFSDANAAAFTEVLSEAFAVGVTLRLADTTPDPVLPLVIPRLATGRYAVRVIHDENADGVLDRGGLVGTPQESYGYSRNARARVAAVEFHDAAFSVGSEPVTIDVRVAPWRITGGDDSPCPPETDRLQP